MNRRLAKLILCSLVLTMAVNINAQEADLNVCNSIKVSWFGEPLNFDEIDSICVSFTGKQTVKLSLKGEDSLCFSDSLQERLDNWYKKGDNKPAYITMYSFGWTYTVLCPDDFFSPKPYQLDLVIKKYKRLKRKKQGNILVELYDASSMVGTLN